MNTICPQEIFNEIKEKAIEVWNTMDNTYGYVDSKVNRIKDLENVGDNFSYILGMFDRGNLLRLLFRVNTDTESFIRKYIAYGDK